MEGFGQLLPARCFRELQPTHGLCDFAGDLELPNMVKVWHCFTLLCLLDKACSEAYIYVLCMQYLDSYGVF